MNTETKFATLFIALVTVVPLLYSGITGIRGTGRLRDLRRHCGAFGWALSLMSAER